ncbi:MAG: ATP synthase F0 subcomplex subunit OSCP atp5 [Sarea resinae]|nr:MAG: ATP synthase F0 subcomplex subunit OSCP atp5 [Sarea resinae]
MVFARAALRASRVAAPRAAIVPRAAVRSYAQAASAAATAQSTKPPVALFGVDGTYASALYTAAAKTSTLDSAASAMAALNAVFKSDPKLPLILSAPTLSPADKAQIVTELQKQIGGADKEGTVKNFLDTLAENNRLSILEGVAQKFEILMGAARGEVELRVTSATPLDSKILSRLESSISKSAYVGQGQKLKVVPNVNPDIRGGLIVEIGDRTIDLSVSSKMARLNKLLTDTL